MNKGNAKSIVTKSDNSLTLVGIECHFFRELEFVHK